MIFDIPRMFATGVIMLAILWLFDHATAIEKMTNGRKTLVKFVSLFVVLFILNLVWPYGSGA